MQNDYYMSVIQYKGNILNTHSGGSGLHLEMLVSLTTQYYKVSVQIREMSNQYSKE